MHLLKQLFFVLLIPVFSNTLCLVPRATAQEVVSAQQRETRKKSFIQRMKTYGKYLRDTRTFLQERLDAKDLIWLGIGLSGLIVEAAVIGSVVWPEWKMYRLKKAYADLMQKRGIPLQEYPSEAYMKERLKIVEEAPAVLKATAAYYRYKEVSGDYHYRNAMYQELYNKDAEGAATKVAYEQVHATHQTMMEAKAKWKREKAKRPSKPLSPEQRELIAKRAQSYAEDIEQDPGVTPERLVEAATMRSWGEKMKKNKKNYDFSKRQEE